jgi:hypothetical protein
MGLSFIYAAGTCLTFSGPSPLGLATIFYCLTFETSLFVASYDSQGHSGGIRPRLHTRLSHWLSKSHLSNSPSPSPSPSHIATDGRSVCPCPLPWLFSESPYRAEHGPHRKQSLYCEDLFTEPILGKGSGGDLIENTVSLLLMPPFVFTKLLPGNGLIKSVIIFRVFIVSIVPNPQILPSCSISNNNNSKTKSINNLVILFLSFIAYPMYFCDLGSWNEAVQNANEQISVPLF